MSQPVGSGGPAVTRATAPASKKLDQMGGARAVDIVDDQLSDPGVEQRDGNGATGSAGADEQHPRSIRPCPFVDLRLHEGCAIQHLAMPRPVPIATDHADHTE